MKKTDMTASTYDAAGKLSDALSDVGDDLLTDADACREKDGAGTEVSAAPVKKGIPLKKHLWKIAAGAAAVLCVGGIWAAQARAGMLSLHAYALAEVKYPAETEPYRGLLLDGKTDSVWSFIPQAGKAVFADVKDDENRLFAPVSTYLALGMLSEVTQGEGQEQILSLMGGCSMETLRDEANAVWVANYIDDGKVRSFVNNALWLDDHTPCAQTVAEQLAGTYYASVYRGEMGTEKYDRAFRTWLSENTEGKLKKQADLMKFSPYPEQMMALSSTMTYAARWGKKFDKSMTERGTFHAPTGDISADFMKKERLSSSYFWSDTFTAVYQYFDHGGIMWFVLPDEGMSFADVMNDDDFWTMLEDTYEYENQKYLYVNLAIPKFDVTSSLDLKDSLMSLGVTEVFEQGNDSFALSGEAGDNIWLSAVNQSTRVTADEDGCTATTCVVMPGAGAAPPPTEEIDFICDRPFLFVLSGTGNIPLFIGAVNMP
ncbi:MAG: hypothetical protein MJ175_12790 [Clostridia bacterium]|nr:hypothetical protein [Clostridia bacterium]